MDTRIIYEKTYYKLLAALRSEKMQILLDRYHKKLEELGVPTSSRFFKRAKDYHEWSRDTLNKGIYYPGLIEDGIINKFFNKPNEEIKLGFWWYVYFGSEKPPVKGTHGKSINIAENKSHIVVTLNVYPWTIKNDIMEDDNLWNEIEKQQKDLKPKQKRQRNRSWETFERELRIYEIYLKENRRRNRKGSITDTIINSEKYKKLQAEYKLPQSTDEKLGSIISRCRKAFAGVNLL